MISVYHFIIISGIGINKPSPHLKPNNNDDDSE